MSVERLSYPATARNREPILEVLRSVVCPGDRVFELASGSGEHATYFAARLPETTWFASDVEAAARASITAWVEHLAMQNVHICEADATRPPWSVPNPMDVVVNINMIHISPWDACEGLMRGCGQLLRPGGTLYLYGPFRRGGAHTAPSNEAFDASLQRRDSRCGVRDLERVAALASQHGLHLGEVIAMPANNLSVIFSRSSEKTVS